MILNDNERRNTPYFAFFTESCALLANYVTVVEDRPMMFVKYCLAVRVSHFWPSLTHPAAWSLCDSWATCLNVLRRISSFFNHVVHFRAVVLKRYRRPLASEQINLIHVSLLWAISTMFNFNHFNELLGISVTRLFWVFACFALCKANWKMWQLQMHCVRFSPPVYSYSSIQAGSGLSLRGESLGSFEIPRESNLGYCNKDAKLYLLRG